jgi:hypothetical protein
MMLLILVTAKLPDELFGEVKFFNYLSHWPNQKWLIAETGCENQMCHADK